MRLPTLILLALLTLTCPSLAAEPPSDAYVAIATELFQSLKKNETVAIQPLTEQETKIPAAILQLVEVGLTAALQRGSDFEIKLISRDRLQAIWKEAREFSNKKFEDMVADAGADVLLIGEVRPTSDGIEISYRAFRVKGAGTGTVLASSKPRVLALDWQKELGAKPVEITDAMKEMAEAVKRLAASGGLVADPKSPADFYHNARALAQRGEVDVAMASYERLFRFQITYADPIEDLMILATRVYGREGAIIYLNKKLKPIMSGDLFSLASQLLSEKPLQKVEASINDGTLSYPPALAAFLISAAPVFEHASFFGTRRAVVKSIEAVKSEFNNGRFFEFYIDQIRAEQRAKDALSKFNNIAPVNLEFYAHDAYLSYTFAKKSVVTQQSSTIAPPLTSPRAKSEKCAAALPGPGYRSDGKKYIITSEAFDTGADVETKINSLYRNRAKIADWQALKGLLSTKQQLAKFIDQVGIPRQTQNGPCDNFLVSMNGHLRLGNGHWLFLARHDGDVPNNWAVLDTIDNHTLDLGRWFWKSQALVVILDNIDAPQMSSGATTTAEAEAALRTTDVSAENAAEAEGAKRTADEAAQPKTAEEVRLKSFRIYDYVDLNNTVEFCFISYKSSLGCFDLRSYSDASNSSHWNETEFKNAKFDALPRSLLCATKLTYTDQRGVEQKIDSKELNYRYDPSKLNYKNENERELKNAQFERFFDDCVGRDEAITKENAN